MKKSKKEKDFLDIPRYNGGKKAFRNFIAQNMQYPKQALAHKIEGDVLLEFQVNDMGEVTEAQIIKGLGYGCDEEAIRLIKKAQFLKTKKQGVRVKSAFKTKIAFRLPKQKNYNYKYQKGKNSQKIDSAGKTTYSYSIKINKE